MTANGWLQIAFYAACLLLVTRPLGRYMVRVYDGSLAMAGAGGARHLPAGRRRSRRRTSTGRATPAAMLLFSLATMLLTYLVLRLQHVLPLNPQHLAAVTDRQAFETAASFTTNTNWQSYGGETTMSYFSQMTQLAFHNFASAAVGMALRRGPGARHRPPQRGPARQLLGRPRARHALPAAAAVADRLAWCSCSRASSRTSRTTSRSRRSRARSRSSRWVRSASQDAIKQLGTNGGGFFNANSAHPFENPTPLVELRRDVRPAGAGRGHGMDVRARW